MPEFGWHAPLSFSTRCIRFTKAALFDGANLQHVLEQSCLRPIRGLQRLQALPGRGGHALATAGTVGARRLSLYRLRAKASLFGGSHAQRSLIEDTFIVALMKSGDLSRARAMLDARLHRRPSPRDVRWLAQHNA